MELYRQGDVGLVKIDNIPQNAKKVSNKMIILAYGEKTGHAHVINSDKCIAYEKGQDLYVHVIAAGVFLNHGNISDLKKQINKSVSSNDHKSIELPIGIYHFKKQREWSGNQVRKIAD